MSSHNLQGLTEVEVESLRDKYGFNEIPDSEDSTFMWVLKKFLNPITIMIEVALVLSVMAGKLEDFIIIAILLMVNVGIEMWQEKKASDALSTLKSTLAPEAVVIRGGKSKVIPARELVPGDIIKIVLGDIVPADVEIISDGVVSVDQSTITGESMAVERNKGEVLYASSVVQRGSVHAKVVNIALDTYIGKSATLVSKAQSEENSHFQKAVIGIGKFLAGLSAFLITIMSVVLYYRGDSLIEIAQFALVLAIASIPVALPAVLSVTMAVGASILSKYNAIVSNFKAVEELAGVDVLCVDKTGTLTKNEIEIKDPIVYGDYSIKDLFIYAVLASEPTHKNKIELAIERFAKSQKLNLNIDKFKVESFVSFTPTTKVTEAKVKGPDGLRYSVVMGAPQVIVRLLTDTSLRAKLEADVAKLADSGTRALAVAMRTKDGADLIGLMPMIDPPREDSKEVIQAMRGYGVDVKMITGDNSAIARYIAKLLNIGSSVVDSINFKHSDDKSRLVNETEVFAEVVPSDKYEIVDILQKDGHIVAMTGDGVNDAPALKKADIGIAVAGASPAARSAADVVLVGSGLGTIKVALEHTRKIFARMQSYATFRIAETIRIVLFVSLTVFIFGFTPISALMIVLLALLNDIPVMAMAYDNASMSDQPVRWHLRETMIVASVLGIMGLLSSFLLLYTLMIYSVPMAIIYTIMFLKLDVSGHSTLYTTRTGRNHFWHKPYPSLKFFLPAFSSRIIGSLMAFFGIFMEPISLTAIIIVWVYSTIWFILNDQIKVLTYKLIDMKIGHNIKSILRLSRNVSLGVLAFAIVLVSLPTNVVYAQLSDAQIEAERARLKNEIVQKELEIQQERMKLLNTKTVRKGYEGEAARLRAKIREANLIIQKQKLAIKALDYKIQDKESTIEELDAKVRREQESLGQLIRKTNVYDNISMVELVLGGESLSEVFTDIDRFSAINKALQESFVEISNTQESLRQEQESLAEAKGDKEELRMLEEKQREEIALTKKEKERLAQLAKNKEKGFEKVIKEKERTVAQIRAQLFALRDSNSGDLSFGTMLGYAKEASARTDVSPALILAILTVETNLGKDLGVGKWNEDMHPTRDVPIFKEIVAELGLNPDEVPVSARPCSAAKRKAVGPGKRCGYGYGGAMGPAQFIPSTWVLYKDRIARVSGQNPPNPWDPRTAVFATALLMMDNGADKGTRTAEHKAAVRYLAGWRNAEKSEYWWYGDRTMRYRDQYAKDIAALGE